MDLISLLLAIGTAYLAYFNFITLRRFQAAPRTKVSILWRLQCRIASLGYAATAVLLLISAVTSSFVVFTVALVPFVVAATTPIVFRVLRRSA